MATKIKGYLCFIVFGGVLLCGVAQAQPSGEHLFKEGKGRVRGGSPFRQMFKDLNLTTEQQAQIEAQKKKHREEAQTIREQLRQKKEEIRDELQKNELDRAKINQIHQDIKSLQGQREDSRLQGILEMREILTPEQFSQLHEKMEAKRQEMKGKMKGRMKGGHEGMRKGKRHGKWRGASEESPEEPSEEPPEEAAEE